MQAETLSMDWEGEERRAKVNKKLDEPALVKDMVGQIKNSQTRI
jgi:hypothetical protein